MAWSFNGTTAIFVQIADKIRADILNGVYPPGSQLPTVRALALDASVNPNTMQRAIAYLEEEGIVCSRMTKGVFVADDHMLIGIARETMKREAVSRMLSELKRLGVTKHELLGYIEKEVF